MIKLLLIGLLFVACQPLVSCDTGDIDVESSNSLGVGIEWVGHTVNWNEWGIKVHQFTFRIHREGRRSFLMTIPVLDTFPDDYPWTDIPLLPPSSESCRIDTTTLPDPPIEEVLP